MSRSLYTLVLFLLACCFSVAGLTNEFPELTNKNTQIISLPDAHVDLALRLYAIDNAQHTIQSATFVQSVDDKVGIYYLEGIRRALERGVSGQFIFDRIGSFPFDRRGKAIEVLGSSDNSRVICLSPIAKAVCKLSPMDVFHIKILAIDVGTPNEIIFVGGRNNDPIAINALDYSIAVRPIDPNQPYLGDDIQKVYVGEWKTASIIQSPKKKTKLTDRTKRRLDGFKEFPTDAFSSAQKKELEELKKIISVPALLETSHPQVFVPQKIRAISHNVITSIVESRVRLSRKQRIERIKSIISNRVADIVAKSNLTDISSMAVRFTPEVKEAIDFAVSSGAEVRLLTNGHKAHHSTMGLGWVYSLEDLFERQTASLGKDGLFRVFTFEPSEEKIPMRPNYMHQKMVVANDPATKKPGIVIVGSDNLNEPSRLFNNELVIVVDDPIYAAHMREKIDSDISRYFLEVTLSKIADDRLCSMGLRRKLANLIERLL